MKDLLARAMRPCAACGLLFLPQASNALRCSDCCQARSAAPKVGSKPWPTSCPVRYGACTTCLKSFVIRPNAKGLRKTCGKPECVAEHRRQLANARKRNREHLERSAYSDITPADELAMRRKARKCPMPGCGVKLTDVPGLPNSKHLDHIVPLNPTAGGTHTLGNVRIICASCNVRRPKDGSDYAGPLTLWAVIPGVAVRAGRGAVRSLA